MWMFIQATLACWKLTGSLEASHGQCPKVPGNDPLPKQSQTMSRVWPKNPVVHKLKGFLCTWKRPMPESLFCIVAPKETTLGLSFLQSSYWMNRLDDLLFTTSTLDTRKLSLKKEQENKNYLSQEAQETNHCGCRNKHTSSLGNHRQLWRSFGPQGLSP